MKLIDAIDQAFIATTFPPPDDLVDSTLTKQDEGSQLAADLGDWRTRKPDSSLLRQMHQELRKLSAATTQWIVPHYLRYALTEEAKYSRMEVSFFVLSLISRSKEEDQQIIQRLSFMSGEQINCMALVLEHLHADSDWSDYMGEDIESALATLSRLGGAKGVSRTGVPKL